MKDRNENNVVPSNTQPDPNKMTLSSWVVAIGAPVVLIAAGLSFTPPGRDFVDSLTATTTPVTQEYTAGNEVEVVNQAEVQLRNELAQIFQRHGVAEEHVAPMFAIMTSNQMNYVIDEMNKYLERHPQATDEMALEAAITQLDAAFTNWRNVVRREHMAHSTDMYGIVFEAHAFKPDHLTESTRNSLANQVLTAEVSNSRLHALGIEDAYGTWTYSAGKTQRQRIVGAWDTDSLEFLNKGYGDFDTRGTKDISTTYMLILAMNLEATNLVTRANRGYNTVEGNLGVGYDPVNATHDPETLTLMSHDTLREDIRRALDNSEKVPFVMDGKDTYSYIEGAWQRMTNQIRETVSCPEKGFTRTLSE